MEALKKQGMEVYEIPQSEIPMWQEATKQVRDDFIKANGEIGKKVVQECLKAN